MKLVIYATHSDGYFDLLIDRASSLGYDIKLLGWNTKWQGFYKRTLDLYNYFLSQDDKDIILCIDGFDSIVLDDYKTLYRKYKYFNSPIVWGVDKSDVLNRWVFKSNLDYILNGGSFIGRNKYLKIVFKEIIDKFGSTNFEQDDQKIANYMINHNELFKKCVKADTESSIFANISYDSVWHAVLNFFNITGNPRWLSHVIEEDGIIRNKVNKCRPSIISGPANINISHFVKHITDCKDVPKRKGYQFFLLKNFKYEAIIITLMALIFIVLGVALIKSLI